MKLIIHRGTHEIGGSCVELICNESRIVIDIGMPLVEPGRNVVSTFDFRKYRNIPGAELVTQGILPPVKGLYAWDGCPPVDGILISHAHQDHFGFASFVKEEVTLLTSRGTIELMQISSLFLSDIKPIAKHQILEPWQEITVGGFTVKPYLVDHSAPDALAFEISARGKRVFYSGDIRGHGRKSVLFENMLKRPPDDIDALLLEGTMLSRPGPQSFPDERAIEAALLKEFTSGKQVNFVFASAQNIDRICSIYRAVKQARATLIIDLYTAYILHCMQIVSDKIPDFNAPGIRIKYWNTHASILADNGHRSFLYEANSRKVELDQFDSIQGPLVILSRANSLFKKTVSCFKTETVSLIWSMWKGYLTGVDTVSQYAREHTIQIKQVHTSGHAVTDDLARLIRAISPRMLIPIHTFEPEAYRSVYSDTRLLTDGEVLEL